MFDARDFLTTEQQTAVREAIAAAEERTSAEVVCALATESGRYDRAESLAGLVVALGMLALVNGVFLTRAAGGGSWAGVAGVSFTWQCVAVVGGFLLGSVLASYWHGLRRLFHGRGEMDQEMWRAARVVFASRGLHRTAGHGGLLIYLSLYERMTVVLADEGVMKKLGQEFLDRMRDAATAELRAGGRQEAFKRAIELAIEPLSGALPVQPADKNELPNELVILHPRP